MKTNKSLVSYVGLIALVVVVVLFVVVRVNLSGTSEALAVTQPVGLAMVGDSILVGQSAGLVSRSLTGVLSSVRPYWFIKNLSFNGGSLSGPWTAINPQNQLLANADVKKIVLMLGTNDWAQSVASTTFKTAYSNFLQVAGGYHPVICVTPLWRIQEGTLNAAGLTIENYRSIIRQECAAKGFPVIEGPSLITNDSRYFVDGIHPNVYGYKLMALNIASAIDPLIQ